MCIGFGKQNKHSGITDALEFKPGGAVICSKYFLWLEDFDTNVNTGRILTATDTEIMRMMVERIVVGDDGIEIHLKCGVTIQQEYKK